MVKVNVVGTGTPSRRAGLNRSWRAAVAGRFVEGRVAAAASDGDGEDAAARVQRDDQQDVGLDAGGAARVGIVRLHLVQAARRRQDAARAGDAPRDAVGSGGRVSAAGGVRGAAAAAVVPASVSPTAKAGPCPASDVDSSERPTTLTGAGGGAAGSGARAARDG